MAQPRTRAYDVPEPSDGEVLVKVRASGICGSDIGYIYRGYKGYVGVSGPAYRGVIAGHEPAGQIVSVGPGCRRFGVGDRVLLYHIVGCGRCPNCRSGYFINCSSAGRSSYGWQRDGGHADYILAAERTCIALPDELSYVDGALISCGFGTAHQGLLRVQVNGGDDLLVVGLGPVGLAAAMVARGLGARHVYGVEASPLRQKVGRGPRSVRRGTAGRRRCQVAVNGPDGGPRLLSASSSAREVPQGAPQPLPGLPSGGGSPWWGRAAVWKPRCRTCSCTNS